MNIQIRHISNTFNYGSSMMAISLINKLNKNIGNLRVYVDARSSEDLERLKQETNSENIFREKIYEQYNLYTRFINKIRRSIIHKKIDAVIIIGGDDISEYYGIENLEEELKFLQDLSRNKKVILLGQTIGPFTENRGIVAKDSLVKTKIYTRDDKCFDYLKNIGFTDLVRGRDLAFLDLPNQSTSNSILRKYNLNENNYYTIVPSGLTKHYTKNYISYINEYVRIIEKLINNNLVLEEKIVLLPHVLLPKDVDDRMIIRDIVKSLDSKYRQRIVAIDDAMLPTEAREILGNGILTITGRMHAAVSTFYMKKPAISLSYSVKYAGVIGEGLGMNNLVIESSSEKLWEDGQISNLVTDKVNFVIDNYDNIVNRIRVNVSETTKLVEEQLDDLMIELMKEKII